jgi:hypothetical protein
MPHFFAGTWMIEKTAQASKKKRGATQKQTGAMTVSEIVTFAPNIST